MSRSGYSDDLDNWAMIKWRGMVASAIRGKRGQQLLSELAEAMDAMPKKELIREALENNGAYCALGVVGARRNIMLADIDPEDPEQVSKAFNIAECLAQEVAYINDEGGLHEEDGKWRPENPSERWTRVRNWVQEQIKSPTC